MTVCRVANRPREWSASLAAILLLAVSAPAGAQGPRLFYESDGTGTPVVLVPDWAHDTGSWFRILPLLRADGRRLVRYDLRGQGRSEPPGDGDYSLAAHRADLLRLLDGLGIERAHLAGIGLGGTIVLEFALEHPERVLSVTAAEPRLQWEDADRNSWSRLLEAWERIGRPTLGEYTSVLVERWLGTGFVVRNGWAVPWYDLMLRRQSATELILSMRAWLAESAPAPPAPSEVPALVVVGEGGMTAFEGEWLETALPRAWRERAEDSRLQPALDAPEELARHLEELWGRAAP
ncbi:MAG TPA: alpha/beta hydrolase [Gemmatimonadota bacterium]|nr:alpha/beta hydrolase [Gemmatimonadota bacterium]